METTSKIHRGYVTKFLAKKENGWALALFAQEENPKMQLRIKGSIAEMQQRMLYEISGVTEFHPKFGTTFTVESYKHAEINSPKAAIKYLSSDLFPGIGKKTATLIVEYYQDAVLAKIKANYDSLDQVPGLEVHQAKLIKERLQQTSDDDLKILFYEKNLSMQIYEAVKRMVTSVQELEAILKNHFFSFARKMKLEPRDQVDKVALFFGCQKEDPERIAYWAEKSALELAFNTGNTYSNLDQLKRQLAKNLGIADKSILQRGFLRAKELNWLYFANGDQVYASEAWEDEQVIVNELLELEHQAVKTSLSTEFTKQLTLVEAEIAKSLKIANFRYDENQVEALKRFLTTPVTLVSGGPGTGKSTLILGMKLLYKAFFQDLKIGIGAPTGRAASRLKETLDDQNAITIHKMLEADENGNFGMNEQFPLPYHLVILDEMSMVENHLFAQFLRAKGSLKKLVLVGDNHQLPPVGYGNLFSDLIASQQFAFCQLKKIHRQEKGNGIIDLALSIQNGTLDQINWAKLANVEVHFDETTKNNYQILEVDYALHQNRVQKSPFHYQIITPFYAGEMGIENLNSFIQNNFNPNLNKTALVYDRGRYRYALGDKIMCLKNNAEVDLTNGEVGTIQALNFTNKKFMNAIVEFSGEKNVLLDAKLFNDMALGYACSVHKTQGSEYQKVAFILEKTTNNFFLNKKLIYTAITRAKEELLIIGDKNLFYQAAEREARPRQTTIQQKLASAAIKD